MIPGPMDCWSRNSGDQHGPPVAIWVTQPAGNRVRLCQECLDGWARNAEVEPELAALHIERIAS